MTIKSFLIGLVIFALITTGMFTFFVDGMTNTNQVIEPEYAEFFGEINETLGSMGQAGNAYLNSSQYGGQTFPNTFSLITSGFGDAIRLVFVGPVVIAKMINSIAQLIGIPSWIVAAFITIIFITVGSLLIGVLRGIRGGV